MKTGVYILQFIPPGGGEETWFFQAWAKKHGIWKKKNSSNFQFFLKEKGENIEFKPLTAVLVNRNSKVHCIYVYYIDKFLLFHNKGGGGKHEFLERGGNMTFYEKYTPLGLVPCE